MEKNFFQEKVPEKVLLSVSQSAAQHALRLDKLVRVCIAAKKYSPETTHEIRILTRKCTAAWQILRRADAHVDHNKSRKGLRALRRCLGPLRDADILLKEFEHFARNKRTGSNDTLSGVLQQRWLQCYLEASAQVRKDGPKYRETLKSIKKQSNRLAPVLRKRHWNKHAERWLKKQWIKWIRSAGNLRDQKQIHDFRIKTKRMRYLLQFLLSQKSPAQPSVRLKQLEELQQELGKHRDLHNVVDWLRQLQEEFSVNVNRLGNLSSSIISMRKHCEQRIRLQDGRLNKLRRKLLTK